MKTYWARALVLASGLALLLGLGLPLRAIAWETEEHRGREAKDDDDKEAKKCKRSTFPATGQTTPSPADTLAGPGTNVPDDGTVKAGGRLRYRDNGDGTITDRNTGLMWEKKSFDAGLHDYTMTFPWSFPFMAATTIWDWLDQINAEGGKGFARHKDWRIPNVKELESIVDYGRFVPAVAPAFNNGVSPGCTVLTCSATAASQYWSSTSFAADPTGAWFVIFDGGFVSAFAGEKTSAAAVRAVRGGCVARAKEEEEESEKAKEKENGKEKDWSSGSSHR